MLVWLWLAYQGMIIWLELVPESDWKTGYLLLDNRSEREVYICQLWYSYLKDNIYLLKPFVKINITEDFGDQGKFVNLVDSNQNFWIYEWFRQWCKWTNAQVVSGTSEAKTPNQN